MTELLITSKVPGKLIYWLVPSDSIEVTSDAYDYVVGTAGSPKLGQTFKLPEDGHIVSLITKGHRVGTPSKIYLELWEWDEANKQPTVKLADLDSKTYSAFSTSDTEITWNISNHPLLEAGKAYALIWRTEATDDSNYYVFRACANIYADGYLIRYDGTQWLIGWSRDLYFKMVYGRRIITAEDLGYSEAYILRIEYLEDGTEIVMDDEITFKGDAGEIDELPTAILIPFKKLEWKTGKVKMYGVGIP